MTAHKSWKKEDPLTMLSINTHTKNSGSVPDQVEGANSVLFARSRNH